MPSEDRILGALEEFKRAQLEHNRINRIEHREMMKEVERLQQWRWKIEGMRISLIGVLGGAVGALLQKIAKFL